MKSPLKSFVKKVRKRAKIRNRYNQAPHLTQDTNGKVTTSQLDITNESQEVSPFPAGDHIASKNRRARKNNKKPDKNNINDQQKNHKSRIKSYLSSSVFLLVDHSAQIEVVCGQSWTPQDPLALRLLLFVLFLFVCLVLNEVQPLWVISGRRY